MNWKFWTRNRSTENERFHLLQELMNGGLKELGEQLSKLARMQYKTGQDLQGKLERLNRGIDSMLEWQAARSEEQTKLEQLMQQTASVTQSLIQWLDDLDFAVDRLEGEQQAAWRQVLVQWTDQLLETLAMLGVRELDVLGRSFDPRWSESIGTTGQIPSAAGLPHRPRTGVPYEIVQVVKRGFVDRHGELLRKALVITVQEEHTYVQQQ